MVVRRHTQQGTRRCRDGDRQRHLVERGIKNPRVLEAFRTVPRHRFLPPKTRRQAYDDESIPIGEGQTITPPYDVAFMTEPFEDAAKLVMSAGLIQPASQPALAALAAAARQAKAQATAAVVD